MTEKRDSIPEIPPDFYPGQREVSFNGYGAANRLEMWRLISVAAVFFALGCVILALSGLCACRG